MADPTNTPMPPGTPAPASPVLAASVPDYAAALPRPTATKPRVLHIGDPVKYNPETYAAFSAQCDIVRPSTPERSRPEFIAALREQRWGDFDAIFRPFWGTGGEMGAWDAELIDLLPASVKVFASAGAGFDWADTKILGERGIIYCNSGLAAAEAVADFAIAMIISTFRHIPWCISAAAAPATFQDCHSRATASSHNLRGRVIGVIGFGNIGQQIAARCHHGFGMAIHYHDVVRKPVALEATVGAVFHDTLEGLIRASDCVVLCTPSGNKVITAETLGWFKKGGRFVNVARGSLVDEEALADALESGGIGTIALDVHAGEPAVSPRLLKFVGERAMLTCHNAGGTVETHVGFEELSMRNIMAVLAGGDAITPVNTHYLKREPAAGGGL
ncbi:related to D-mandelate dehydrogenase [Cephalotrichum gorgonifer]|uniref:Related to D-mandelate dehydrogenase n=1 Tax=Cephalotrichum gorgonifer TaxID=2041049 RepID=A0AAE8MSS3_9PEZI|nr:related to D-mandelate dehydrogenase [Cephalotrichum gorgonifer]